MKRWLVSNSALLLRSWDDEFVVYNESSGDTHLLDGVAGEILQALIAAPAEIEALVTSLGAKWDTDPSAELHRQIERILVDLQALALVEQR
jgi:PqqD family protein of HPr-rel-A system